MRLVSDGVEFMVMSLGIEGFGRGSHPLPGVHKKARLCFSVHRLVRTGNPQRAHIRRGYPLPLPWDDVIPPSDESIKFSAGQIWKCSSTSQRISEKRHYLYLIQLFFTIVVFKLE